MTPEETRQASEDVFSMLAHATAGEASEAATLLQNLGTRLDVNGMYGVCCALASACVHCMKQVFDEVPDFTRGDMWVFEELRPGAMDADAPSAFAMRFLTAYANGDTDTTLALFGASLEAGDEEHVSSVCALLTNVAGIARLALEQARPDGE